MMKPMGGLFSVGVDGFGFKRRHAKRNIAEQPFFVQSVDRVAINPQTVSLLNQAITQPVGWTGWRMLMQAEQWAAANRVLDKYSGYAVRIGDFFPDMFPTWGISELRNARTLWQALFDHQLIDVKKRVWYSSGQTVVLTEAGNRLLRDQQALAVDSYKR